MDEAHQAAQQALQAGLSTVPPKMDGTKAPIGTWKQYQRVTPSQADIDGWYSNGQTGVGLVCGAVSGGLECLDFDTREAWQQYKDAAKECGLMPLLNRVANGYAEQTPNGLHLLYKCSEIAGNKKLAQAASKKTIIETRGEGCFIITAPSSGKVNAAGDYVLKAGGFDTITTITPAERSYDKFGAHVLLNYGGDFKAATRALAMMACYSVSNYACTRTIQASGAI